MKKMNRLKKLISIICIISLALSLFTAYAADISSDSLTEIRISSGKVFRFTPQEMSNIVSVSAEEAKEIAELFVCDAAKTPEIDWDENTKVINVIPMYDQTDTDTVTAYTVKLNKGYVVVSAFLDAKSLIPEWSDKAEPLYTELDLSDNDKIVYLGNYEYYLDEGDSKVTGLSGEQIEKNNLVNFVDENRNISNIPESAYLEYDYNNVSVCSEIVDPIGHANANYGGPFSYTRRIDYWTNYMDYYTTDFGNRNQYTNHCGPTAITNLIAAFRNRYPAGAAGIPNDNDTLFLTIADKGILNNFFSNTNGTPNNRAYYYIDYIFDMYGISPYQMYEISSNADDIEEYEFPMGYNAIFYMSLKKESIYEDHAVIAYGLSEMESQTTGAQKAYFHIADGWGESPRYIELNSDIACAVGIQFYY